MQEKFSKTLVDSPAAGSGRAGASGDNEKKDWQAYRDWLAQVTNSRARTRKDSTALYSYSGYRDWTAKIRKEWNETS